MKVSPQKGGHGHVTSYRIIIGSAAARRCGFVDDSGERAELEAIENPEDKSILIRVKRPQGGGVPMKHRKLKIGDEIERLKIIECLGVKPIHGGAKNVTVYLCKCACGELVEVPGIYIGKNIKSCGCLQKESRERPIPNGAKFERLTVIRLYDTVKGRGHRYLCRCSCPEGGEIVVSGGSLRQGDVKSCGCLHGEQLRENAKKAYAKMFVGGTNVAKISATGVQKNNTSGVRGVNWHRGQKKWVARISFKGKAYSLGYFDDIKEARAAREEAERVMFEAFLEKQQASLTTF